MAGRVLRHGLGFDWSTLNHRWILSMTQFLHNGQVPYSRDPTVRRIMKLLAADLTTEIAITLAQKRHDVSSLAHELGRDEPEVSRTLNRMRRLGMAQYDRDKRNHIYSLDKALDVALNGSEVHFKVVTPRGGKIQVIMPRDEIW